MMSMLNYSRKLVFLQKINFSSTFHVYQKIINCDLYGRVQSTLIKKFKYDAKNGHASPTAYLKSILSQNFAFSHENHSFTLFCFSSGKLKAKVLYRFVCGVQFYYFQLYFFILYSE